jgi:hypothetical protein
VEDVFCLCYDKSSILFPSFILTKITGRVQDTGGWKSSLPCLSRGKQGWWSVLVSLSYYCNVCRRGIPLVQASSRKYLKYIVKSYPRNRSWKHIGLSTVKDLTLTRALGNRFTDGGKHVSSTHQPHFTPQKHYFCLFYLLNSFLLQTEWTPGPSAAGRIR